MKLDGVAHTVHAVHGGRPAEDEKARRHAKRDLQSGGRGPCGRSFSRMPSFPPVAPAGEPMVAAADNPKAFAMLVDVLSRGGVAIAPGDTMYGIMGHRPGRRGAHPHDQGEGRGQAVSAAAPRSSWAGASRTCEVPARLAPILAGAAHHRASRPRWRYRRHSRARLAVSSRPSPRGRRTAFFHEREQGRGSPPCRRGAMRREFEQDVDLIYDAGTCRPGPPSTLVDATTQPRAFLREVALTWHRRLR